MIDRARREADRVRHGLARRGREAVDRAGRTVEIARASASGADPSELARVARRAASLVGRRRFTLDEAFTLGLLDPRTSDEAVGQAVSKRQMIAVQARLNPNEFWYLTEDKGIFYRHAEALGVRVPALYAILCESGPGWSVTGEVVADRRDWERLLSETLPDTFVIKPARGYYGLDIRVIERRDGALHQLGRGEISAAALCEEIAANRQFHVYVVQERLRNGDDVPGGRTALQTVRISTLVNRDGSVDVINSFFKTALDGASIDNFRFGASGNLVSAIDVHRGTFVNLVAAGEHGVLHDVEPPAGTCAPVPGERFPRWDECCDLVRAAAPLFLPMRCLGWDVAVTPEGPQIVEANMWWDPIGTQESVRTAVEIMTKA